LLRNKFDPPSVIINRGGPNVAIISFSISLIEENSQKDGKNFPYLIYSQLDVRQLDFDIPEKINHKMC
jgi:hypothetical protein